MPEQPRNNILIVDDDEDIVRMLSVFLESRGYVCRVGVTGAQGAMTDLRRTALVRSAATLAETLLETELFGHEAGSFTGATRMVMATGSESAPSASRACTLN